jgi:hypothetical protein
MIFPSPAGMSLNQTLQMPGIISLFPARERLVSDIPAGEGKIFNLFLQCIVVCTGCIECRCVVCSMRELLHFSILLLGGTMVYIIRIKDNAYC